MMKFITNIFIIFLAIQFQSFTATAENPPKNIALFAHSHVPILGIMGVDSQELGNLISFMEHPIQKTTQGMRDAYKGKLWGLDTVILISNEEKAAASSAVVDLILQHHVDAIIFIGTAGALDARLNIGDVVIPKKLIQYDVDFRPLFPIFQIPFMSKRDAFTNDPLRQLAVASTTEFLEQEMGIRITPEIREEMHIHSPHVFQDMVATADRFLISDQQIANLQIEDPEVSSIEMEGAAAAQTASDYNTPFILIRTIANYVDTPVADENRRVALDYVKFLKNVQWVYSDGILKRLCTKIKALWTKNHQKNSENHKQPLFNSNQSTPIGIICSLPLEAETLTQLFTETPSTITQGSRTYYRGKIANTNAVIVASGIGKSAAAATATDMILSHRVKNIINVGTANAVDGDVKENHLVISENLIEHDVDVRPFRPIFEISTISLSKLPTDVELRTKIAEIAQMRFSNQVFLGDIASGDRFIINETDRIFLKSKLPQLLCVDSESAPEAQIAYQYGIPFVAIKAITGLENPPYAPICVSKQTRIEHLKKIQTVLLELIQTSNKFILPEN